jgi:predicted ATPase/class 3 adenylate cyclase
MVKPETSMSNLPTGTVTFLFTDIEGSTRLSQEYPSEMPVLLARHNEILRQEIETCQGFVFQVVGDSFCAAFYRPDDAIHAALNAQQRLQNEEWSPAPIKVRMGIHTGTAQYDSNARENQYKGYTTLALVQRIMSAGHGGQVLISNAVHQSIQDKLLEDVQIKDMGECRLKDVLHPEHLYQICAPRLLSEFPPLKTLEVFNHNLPAQLTSFIGREKEMDDIKKLIAGQRMVTLTGSGGAGKTRLGLQVAAACLNQFANGVWLVELATITDPALVPQTLFSVFKLREDNQRTVFEILIEHLRGKNMLILLDNCEHLIDACAQLGERLLQGCPHLKILASSREALGIAGEISYRVPSLQAPNPAELPPLDILGKTESIRLFMDRATAMKPDLTLTEDNASFIAQICHRLDGIPLAIELAASRVKALTPEQIASRLDDRFSLLTGGSRTALPRQQTLRALIDWSYSLLSEDEKTLFRRLAVFVGGWTLEAAESVCGEEDSKLDILELLTKLVDKSLVLTTDSEIGLRYRRLETIRQYSREKFFETDEVETLRDRHLNYFLQFAERADENLKGSEQLLWQRRMSAEQDNLRAALEWGFNKYPYSALSIVGAANLFWTAGGYSAEGFRLTQKALEQVQQSPFIRGTTAEQRQVTRAKALRGLTRLYLSLGDNARAKRAAEESVAIYRRSKDRRGLSFALVILAYPMEFLGERESAEAILKESYLIAREEKDIYVMSRALNLLARLTIVLRQDLDKAQKYIDESLRQARKAGLRSQEAQAQEVAATIAFRRNKPEEAREHYNESVKLYQEIDARFNVILERSNLAHMERTLGNYAEALDYYRETVLAFRDIGQTGAICHQLECFGFIALAQDRPERALQLFAAADALRKRASTPMIPDEQRHYDEQVNTLRARMEPDKFETNWSAGKTLSMDEAIALAIEETLPED